MTPEQPQPPSRPQQVLRAVASFARDRYGVVVRHISLSPDGNRVTLWILDAIRDEHKFGVVTIQQDGDEIRVVGVELARLGRGARGSARAGRAQ